MDVTPVSLRLKFNINTYGPRRIIHKAERDLMQECARTRNFTIEHSVPIKDSAPNTWRVS